jgi:L-ribulose-5-phosphate 4-epimerase
MATALNLSNSHELLRARLAAATRILNMAGILDYSGHISARIPGTDMFFIQTRNESRAEVSPGSVVLCDLDCNVLEGKGKPPSETVIHTEILRSRPDVNSVIHCHMDLAIAFTMMKDCKILPMRSRAARWESGIPMHVDPSHIKKLDQGQALARTLGPHHAALMRGHGMVLAAESVPALVTDAIHFEENANAQLQVLNAGRTPAPLSAAEMEAINKLDEREHHIEKLWNYYVAKAKKAEAVPANWNVDL